MKYIDADKLIAEIERMMNSETRGVALKSVAYNKVISLITSLQQEQPKLLTIKGWIARDDAGRLGLYDQKPTRKTELGVFSGTVHSWVIGDTWIGRFSLDQTAKTLFPNLCWADDPMEVELMFKPIQEQPEVDLEKLGEIARHLIAVKDHEEYMRLDEGEGLLLERIGYPEMFNARKEE